MICREIVAVLMHPRETRVREGAIQVWEIILDEDFLEGGNHARRRIGTTAAPFFPLAIAFNVRAHASNAMRFSAS